MKNVRNVFAAKTRQMKDGRKIGYIGRICVFLFFCFALSSQAHSRTLEYYVALMTGQDDDHAGGLYLIYDEATGKFNSAVVTWNSLEFDFTSEFNQINNPYGSFNWHEPEPFLIHHVYGGYPCNTTDPGTLFELLTTNPDCLYSNRNFNDYIKSPKVINWYVSVDDRSPDVTATLFFEWNYSYFLSHPTIPRCRQPNDEYGLALPPCPTPRLGHYRISVSDTFPHDPENPYIAPDSSWERGYVQYVVPVYRNGSTGPEPPYSSIDFYYPEGYPPFIYAGPDQTVDEGQLVALDGIASADAANFLWSQTAGPHVSLSNTIILNPEFVAPNTGANTILTFDLVAEDGSGAVGHPDSVNVTVISANNPPLSDAGSDESIKEGAIATLDGSASYDPDGDSPLGYAWTQTSGPDVTLNPSNTAVSPTFTAPTGIGNVMTFKLVVDDGRVSSTADSVAITIVENSPPVSDAGPDQTINEGTMVYLNGSFSNDQDGDELSFNWAGPVLLSSDSSPTPSFTAPMVSSGGQALAFDLVVTDDDPVNPLSSLTDQVVINVHNTNDPPSCDLARAVCSDSKNKSKSSGACMLWPPNHKLIEVGVTGVADDDYMHNDVRLMITSVTQDEPVNDGGDSYTGPDALIQSGAMMDTVLLRAERTGLGGSQENGRVYVVNFTADDGFESCTGSVVVGVPHNRKDAPTNDGQLYDSTQP